MLSFFDKLYIFCYINKITNQTKKKKKTEEAEADAEYDDALNEAIGCTGSCDHLEEVGHEIAALETQEIWQSHRLNFPVQSCKPPFIVAISVF